MRKESSNQFTEGLVCDLNPINTPNTVLTDALNATIITYDGNEHSLQNDRGNYQLKNCRLKPNYIPVGLKEYGDILYVVSYNPLDNHVEIGSYPSPLNVESSEDSHSEFELESVIGSFHDSINYSDLVKRCKLLIYTGKDEERYKIYPGDEYKINSSEESEYKYETLEYFIIDENRKRYDVSDIIEPDNQWHNVPWQVPGWLATQYRIGNFEDFDMSIRSLIVPAIVDTDEFGCKANLHFQFKVSDKLFLPIQKGTNEQIVESENRIKSDLFIKLTIKNLNAVIEQDIPLTDDGKFVEWYMDSKILWTKRELDINNLHKNDNVVIEAMPYLKIEADDEIRIINYDNLKETYSFTLNTIGTSADFNIAENLWKFYTEPNGNQLYLEFDVSGPNVTSELVNLYYRIHNINTGGISTWKEMPGYMGISDQINSSLEFNDALEPESIYIIEFGFASDVTSITTINHTIKKVIITSSVFGDFVGSYSDFNEIYFRDWAINGYNKSLKINKVSSKATFSDSRSSVSCDHYWNSNGYLTKNGTVLFDDNVLNKLWSEKSFNDKGWVPAAASSEYKDVGIDVGFSKEFNTQIETQIKDYTLLKGELWDNLPGITLNLKDPFSKIIASIETSRNNLSNPIILSATSSRGKSKHYGTILNNESFRNISGIDQIDEIPLIMMTVESVRSGGNNQLDVRVYDDGLLTRQSDNTFKNDTKHVKKTSAIISEGVYNLNSAVPTTIYSLLKDYQFGILGIIAKQVEVVEGRYQLLHGSEEILRSKNGEGKNRFYTYLVIRKKFDYNYCVIIPIQSSEENLWNINIKYPQTLSTYSWSNTSRTDNVLIIESIKEWVNKFVAGIRICPSNHALDYYNLLSIDIGNNVIKNADTYKLDVNINAVSKWPIFNNKYDLLNSDSRDALMTSIGTNICGNLFISDTTFIDTVNTDSIEIRSESLNDNEFSAKINEFDKKISLISSMVKAPDLEGNDNLISQIEGRLNSRGIYYLDSHENIRPLIEKLNSEYSSNSNLKYIQLYTNSDEIAMLRVKAENDDLYFGRVATNLTIK